MPQLQNLVLTDRAGTPANHTFVPRDIVGGIATVVESSGVPLGDKRVTLGLRRTTENGRYKATLKFAFPTVVTETINGVSSPKVVRTAYVDVDFTFDPTSTEQERKDVVGMVQSAFDADEALTNDFLTKLQGIY